MFTIFDCLSAQPQKMKNYKLTIGFWLFDVDW